MHVTYSLGALEFATILLIRIILIIIFFISFAELSEE